MSRPSRAYQSISQLRPLKALETRISFSRDWTSKSEKKKGAFMSFFLPGLWRALPIPPTGFGVTGSTPTKTVKKKIALAWVRDRRYPTLSPVGGLPHLRSHYENSPSSCPFPSQAKTRTCSPKQVPQTGRRQAFGPVQAVQAPAVGVTAVVPRLPLIWK